MPILPAWALPVVGGAIAGALFRPKADPRLKSQTLLQQWQRAAGRPAPPSVAGADPLSTEAFGLFRGFAQEYGPGAGAFTPYQVPSAYQVPSGQWIDEIGFNVPTQFDVPAVGLGHGVARGPGAAALASGFMNPYESSVVSGMEEAFRRQRDDVMRQAAELQARDRTFGGSRAGLFQAQALSGLARDQAQQLAALRHAGFESALRAAGQEAARISGERGQDISDLLSRTQLGVESALRRGALGLQAGLGLGELLLNRGQLRLGHDLGFGRLGLEHDLGHGQLGLSRARLGLDAAMQMHGAGDYLRALQQAALDAPWRRFMEAQGLLNQGGEIPRRPSLLQSMVGGASMGLSIRDLLRKARKAESD